MERRLRESGAEFEKRHGWLVATKVPGEEKSSPRIRDRSHEFAIHEGESPFEFEFRRDTHAHFSRSGSTFVAWPRERERRLPESFVEMTAAYSCLEIEGSGADVVMRRLTDLDLEALPAIGKLVHIRAFVFRPDEARFLIFFNQEYGHYLWEVVVDTAEPLGGGPAGVGT